MFEVTDLLSFNIGFFVGVFGSYLIYLTYSVIANYAAKKKLDLFFERFGALKGIAFYEQIAESCDNSDYKRRISALTEEYIKLAHEKEDKMDALVSEYMQTSVAGDDNGN